MELFDRQKHWENVYQTKQLNEVSWYQPIPETSLEFLTLFEVPVTAKIIDIGGGDSFFADYLLEKGYQDITVLDISEAAINRAKTRLGNLAERIKWIVADITEFEPTEYYDYWHDRAAFHFLSNKEDISRYVQTTQKYIRPTGALVIGTFSEKGPTKCSGLEIKQYSESTMTERFQDYFEKRKCISVDHKTPFDTSQNFIFCGFTRKTETAMIQ